MVEKGFKVFIAGTIRQLISGANKMGIVKENVVSIIKENGQFLLIYYTV